MARPHRWRRGESNPGPSILQRRRLRAQPTASIRGAGLHRQAAGLPIPNQSRPAGPGTPADPSCSTTSVHQGQEPLRRTGCLSQAASANFGVALMVVRQIFYEDFGDLGSLPTPQTSTSKPVRPHRDDPILHHLCDEAGGRPRRPRGRRAHAWSAGRRCCPAADRSWTSSPPPPPKGTRIDCSPKSNTIPPMGIQAHFSPGGPRPHRDRAGAIQLWPSPLRPREQAAPAP